MKTGSKSLTDAIPNLDDAGERALHARRRIEQAVENGQLPVWVLDACEAWEQAALAYGTALARRASPPASAPSLPIPMPASRCLH